MVVWWRHRGQKSSTGAATWTEDRRRGRQLLVGDVLSLSPLGASVLEPYLPVQQQMKVKRTVQALKDFHARLICVGYA